MRVLLPALTLFTLAACAPKAAAVKPTADVKTPPAVQATTAADPSSRASDSANAGAEDDGPLAAPPVYYGLDSSQLADDARPVLQTLADRLRKHPRAKVVVQGHTCELGTSEYNLQLGQKRAVAARDYLVRLGVEETRVAVISYGEERPAVDAHDEASLAKNRRSEFEINP